MMIPPMRAKIPGLICLSILCGILWAGLSPFHHPRNEVTWLEDKNGLRFGVNGTVLSSGTFQMPDSQQGASCAIEIWLHPSHPWNSNTFLGFYTPENPLQFSLLQHNAGLIVRSGGRKEQHQTGAAAIDIDYVFRQRRLVFLTITSGTQGTAVYVDGALVRAFPDFRFSGKNLAGQLVIGTSPVAPDSWPGKLRGLAIYHQDLTAAQVFQHYQTWTNKGRPDVAEEERAVALYLFEEHTGNTVHNKVRSGVDLYIPDHYMIFHQLLLEPPWEEYRTSRTYWKNVLINIAGFIPLGFFFYAYWSWARPIKQARLATVILGATVSITMEILQAYLPTRNSGVTDIFTNTFGTWVGVMLYRSKIAQTLYREGLRRIPFAGFR
jgi:VanZ family protein